MRFFGPLAAFVLFAALAGPAGAQEQSPAMPAPLAAPEWLTFDWLQKQKSVRLAWNPVEGAFGYRILRGQAQWGDLEQVGSTKNLRWFDEKTSPGAAYRYAVVAYNGDLQSPSSEVRTIVVPGGETPPVAAQGDIPPPEWVLAAGLLDTTGPVPAFQVHLVWIPPPTEGIVGYNVHRNSESGAPASFLGARPATETRFVDQPAWEPGRTWYYSVRAIGPDFRQSEPTPERAVTLVARGAEGAVRSRLSDRDAVLLRGILTDQDPVVRLLAAETLADAENAPTVVGILAEALADSGADQAVRLTAVAGLGRILAAVSPGESPDDRVVASLARALPDADPDVAARARATLLRVTGEDLGDDPAAWIEWFSRPVEPMPIQETAPAP